MSARPRKGLTRGRDALYVSPRGVRVPSPNLGVQAELMRPTREPDNGIGLGRIVYAGSQVCDQTPFSCTRVWNPYGRWLGRHQPTQEGMTLVVNEARMATMAHSQRLPPAHRSGLAPERTPANTATSHRMSVLVGWGGDERAAAKGAGGHDLVSPSPMESWARDLRQASLPLPSSPSTHTLSRALSVAASLSPSLSHSHTRTR